MKKLILSLAMILVPIISFSQTTSTQIVPDSIPVSAEDIKYINLIFAEHESLLKENKLLNTQIKNYESLTSNLEETIGLQKQEINSYQELDMINTNKIQSLSTEIKKKNSQLLYWQIGGITVTVGLILALILK